MEIKFKIIIVCFLAHLNVISGQVLDAKELVSWYSIEISEQNFDAVYNRIKEEDIDTDLITNLYNLTEILYYRDSYEKKQINVINQRDNTSYSKCIKYLFNGYYKVYKKQNSPETLEDFKNALLISQDLQNKNLIQFCRLSILEFYKQEILQSNDQFNYHLEKYKENADSNIQLFLYNLNKIEFLSRAKELSNIFFDYIKKNELILKQNTINQNITSKFYVQKAYAFETKKKLDSAKYYYNKVISINKDKPFYKPLIFKSFLRLSDIAITEKKTVLALDYVSEAEKYKSISSKLTSDFYIKRFKSKIFKTDANYEKAYTNLKESIDIEYDLDYRTNSLQISNLETRLQTAEKEKQILIEQQKKKQNRNIAIGLGSLLLFGGITFLLIQKNTKRKQLIAEQDKELQIQKLATVLKEQELTSIDAMIEGQEKERQRIANDLHDDLGSLMANVKLHFNALKEKKSPELYEKTNTLLDEAYNKVRSVAHAKNSGVMAKKGLLKAINDMANTISDSNKLHITVVDHGLEHRLENSLELTIFRIIQELITNVIKHAEAVEATIHITNHDDSLNIMVEDNGKGFNTKTISKVNGMGIHSIDKRIENLGGIVTIESEHNKGTTVIIDIPS